MDGDAMRWTMQRCDARWRDAMGDAMHDEAILCMILEATSELTEVEI